MFKKMASDALGLSDIGIVVPREDFDKTESDDFVKHEKQEKIYFLIKTKSDEYCFTNLALIHVDGTSAMSKKRTLRRYDYETTTFTDVTLETAGTIDLDVEIKFTVAGVPVSIDIHKKFDTEIKDLYKALHEISTIMHNNTIKMDYAQQSLNLAASAVGRNSSAGAVTPSQSFEQITRFANSWLVEHKKEYKRVDYSDVFELYINQ